MTPAASSEAAASAAPDAKPIKGLVNVRGEEDGGTIEYKVRWAGCEKADDSWVAAASIPESFKRKFEDNQEKRKRRKLHQ